MEITGRNIIGLTDSELLEHMLNDGCPYQINKRLEYKMCCDQSIDALDMDCLICFKKNLEKGYDIDN